MTKPCIICYRLVAVADSGSLRSPHQNVGEVKKVNDDAAPNLEGEEELLVRFFRLLGRHLQDVGGDGGTLTHFPIQKFVKGGLLSCCGECSKILTDFCQLSHQMKVIELHLQWKLSTLKNIMSCAQRVPGRLRGFREGAAKQQGFADFDPDELIDLKRDLIQKCRLMLQAPFPRVIAHKCDGQKEAKPSVDHDPVEFSPPALVTPTPDMDDADIIIPVSPEALEGNCETMTKPMESEEPECQNPPSENEDIEIGDVNLTTPTNKSVRTREARRMPRRFQCLTCGNSFSSISNRSQHVRLHCPGRKNKSKSKGSFKKAWKTHSISNKDKMTKRHRCPNCPKAFTRGTTLREHVQAAHFGQRLNCGTCPKSFTNSANRLTHMKHKCPGRKKSMIKGKGSLTKSRQVCAFILAKDILKNPLANVSGTGGTSLRKTYPGKRFPCRSCSATFTQSGSRDRHMKNYCSSRIVNKQDVPIPDFAENHLAKTSERFPCRLCSTTFTQAWNRDRHTKKYCPLRSLSSGDGSKQHMDTHTPHPPVPPVPRRAKKDIVFKCPTCPKAFRQRRTLKEHIQFAHLGRGFKCGTCDRSFSASTNRWLHMKKSCPGRNSVTTGESPDTTQAISLFPSGGGVTMKVDEVDGNESETFILPDADDDIPEDPLAHVDIREDYID